MPMTFHFQHRQPSGSISDQYPVMLETWPRESRVRLAALVMLETWLQESGVSAY